MARKSTDFNVVFHLPENEEAKQQLSKMIGELHVKLIHELLDKKTSDINKKNRIISEVLDKVRSNAHG